MERLTDKHWRNCDPWECCGQANFCQRGCHDPGGCANGCIVLRLYARLAAYEDTGLTTEEVSDLALQVKTLETIEAMYDGLWNPEHLRELVRAENDGRLVVMPCKVGDTVYVIGEKRIMRCEIDEAYLDDKKGTEFLVSFDCDSDCDGCPFNSWRQEYSGEYSCDGEYGHFSIFGSDFGKNIFLSREVAEEVLAQKEGTK